MVQASACEPPDTASRTEFTISLRAANRNDCANRQWRNFLEFYEDIPAFTSEAGCRAARPAPPVTAT